MDPNIPQQPVQQDPYYPPEEDGGLFANKKRIVIVALIVVGIIALIFLIVWFSFFRQKEPVSEGDVALTYWGVWDDTAVMQPVLDEFTRQNPSITVKYEKQDIKTVGDYVDRLETRTAEGNGPDIMRFHSSWLTQIQDILLPFPNDVVANTGLDENYFTVVERDLKRDGAYYGLPLSIDTLALYINSDLFANVGASPPSNWEDLDALATQLTSVDEDGVITTSGVAMGTYDNIAHAPDIMALLFLQNGAELRDLTSSDPDNEADPESAPDALEFFTRYSQGRGATWGEQLENSKIAFSGGKLAMYFGYSWDQFEIDAYNPNLNYQVVPVPVLPGSTVTVASYWAEGVSNKTQHPAAAFKLMEYLGQDETLQKIYELQAQSRGMGSPYPKRNLAELLKGNERQYAFLARADDAVSTFFSSDTYDAALNEEMNVYLGNAVRSVINDNTSYQSAIQTLSNGVSQVLSKYE